MTRLVILTVGRVQVNIVTKFEGPSLNHLKANKFAHSVATTEYASYAITPKPTLSAQA
jgi:hypothetical protein